MRLVLYDGTCGLCDKAVQWLLDHDVEGVLHYAPLQGETTAGLRGSHPAIPSDMDTMVFIEGDRVWVRSHAILTICSYLPTPWRWLGGLRIFPAWLTDPAYRLVSSTRYSVWGRADVCRLPEPEVAARFLP
ncbi:MAG: DUF393 domain-containing protein [Proteobacteria bacterium]|nr:DUF393 domain-containing protein [Pseudomonadota bacterium]